MACLAQLEAAEIFVEMIEMIGRYTTSQRVVCLLLKAL
jgi:hypothetical protein